MVVLRGRLDVVIVEARGLLNLDSNILRPSDKSDPYCVVDVEGAAGIIRIGKTFTIDDNLNPKWFYKITTDLSQDVAGLRFTVKDKDIVSSETIGTCYVAVHEFTGGRNYESTLDLKTLDGKPAGVLVVQVYYSGTESCDTAADATLQERVRLKGEELRTRLSQSIHWGESDNNYQSFSMSMEMGMLLHGALDIVIEKAVSLPNLDSSILSLSKKDVSDPFVVVSLEDANGGTWKVATTRVIDNNLNPIWNESFRVDVCHHVVAVIITVKDKDFLSSEVIGSITFTADSIFSGDISGTFDLFRNGEKGSKKAGQITLQVHYTGKQHAITDPEVPECLYPLRKHNHVRLYQDAHCPSIPLQFNNQEGNIHVPNDAWKDLYNTIVNAKKLICIVGWSVSAKISLLRWEGEDSRTLGELLSQKAKEGLYVRLLLWDELTSNDLKKTGAMSTEDEETFNFFKGTGVLVNLVPRDRATKDMISTKNPFTKLCYTHHQKVVITDTESPDAPGMRHLIAYVGGLDLTGGRFDTPEHPLFRTLIYEHLNDFRNRMHPTTSASGPREPWHDIHSRVEGPTAVDLLYNFQERWQKQGEEGEPVIQLIQKDPEIALDYNYKNNDAWNVQMFRSINSDSAIFNWQNVTTRALSNKKGRAFDNSLHRAYIHNIRRAQKFIYIENQYFLGSSHVWLDCRDAKAGNLVPLEICTRIEEKIRANERFVAYIVIPMFPEGKPADKVTQEILHWQFRSIEMMYSRIGAALQDVGSEAHPQDYLVFMCLGKKEPEDQVPSQLTPPQDPEAARAFEHRRLMIYVHSKMAIFDDEYIIVGSANINDRSLSGNRDTEIAIGAYQPNHFGCFESGNLSYGDVSLFRRSLWSEHMGIDAPINLDPSSLECVRRVRDLGEEALIIYKDDGSTPCPRHMLIYPLQVNHDGRIRERPDCSVFPDTNASVIGARSKLYPCSLTT